MGGIQHKEVHQALLKPDQLKSFCISFSATSVLWRICIASSFPCEEEPDNEPCADSVRQVLRHSCKLQRQVNPFTPALPLDNRAHVACSNPPSDTTSGAETSATGIKFPSFS
ncbi:hypothetical protein PBY51_009275 [Eleginops maclovinus]|uniref:Uncharacterized protein n=1 Tax=Eleginops maclovinus TaxID=56733 RepID=A0AAN8AQ76_ELEMC|nr:hypothetical protein PBY51_009275 [Eleginops maclovinus]